MVWLRPYVFAIAKAVGLIGGAFGVLVGALVLFSRPSHQLEAQTPVERLIVPVLESAMRTASFTVAISALVVAGLAAFWYLYGRVNLSMIPPDGVGLQPRFSGCWIDVAETV